jgi:hypothetical protein
MGGERVRRGRPVRGRANDAAAARHPKAHRRRARVLRRAVRRRGAAPRPAALRAAVPPAVAAGARAALRHDPLDADMLQAQQMAQAVHRDIHKMRAFVRFARCRATTAATAARRLVRARPPHRRGQRAVLRAPLRAHALGHPHARALRRVGRQALLFAPARPPRDAPPPDAGEQLWLTYYQHIFNPARLKLAMMRQGDAAPYWHNLPEAALISRWRRRRRRAAVDDRAPATAARRIPRAH